MVVTRRRFVASWASDNRVVELLRHCKEERWCWPRSIVFGWEIPSGSRLYLNDASLCRAVLRRREWEDHVWDLKHCRVQTDRDVGALVLRHLSATTRTRVEITYEKKPE